MHGPRPEESAALIGASIKRKEDPRLLRGEGRYVDDFRLPGMVSAALVRSPHAHAHIRGIDLSRAAALPGVLLVAAAADVGRMTPIPIRLGPRSSLIPFLQRPLAQDRVRYVGEPVALIAAADRYLAEDAADLVEISYETMPPIGDVERALDPAAAVLQPGAGTNLAARVEAIVGDPDAALATAAIRIAERLTIQRHTAIPMETRGIVAAFDSGSGTLTVWGPTKVPHFNRRVLAELLSLPEHRIRFIEPDVGGGFGVRGEFYPEDFLIPWAAMRLRRPVKWIEDRREHFLAANHSRQQIHDVELGVTRDGRIVALVDRVQADMGAYLRTHGVTVPELTAAQLPGPYKIPHYRCEILCVLTNKTPTGTYRAPGRYEANFVRERMMDLVARRLGEDPVEIRRRNFIRPDEMPFAVGTAARGEPVIYDTGNYASTLDAALDTVGYATYRARQAAPRGAGRYLGIGVAPFVEKSGLVPGEAARVEVDALGHVVVYSGAASLGQGMETTFAQLCAHELGATTDDVTVVHGDTAVIPVGVGTYASRTTGAGGTAVVLAARAVKEKLLDAAARLLEAARQDLEVARGRVAVRGAPFRAVSFKELGAAMTPADAIHPGTAPGLSASEFFQATKNTYPYGTAVAVVEVDPGTATIAILDFAVAYDVGKAINPMLIRGQLVGGLCQGIGGAVLEELIYDAAGQPLATTFMDYLIPTSMEMPARITTTILEEAPTPWTILGAKGAGEGGIAAAGAAIANAVSDALRSCGGQVTGLPISPARVLALLGGAAADA